MRPLTMVSCLCAVLLRPGLADHWDSRFQAHGFVTQGFVKTSDNRFFGDSEDGSFDFTEIALNASYRPMPELLMSGQILSRRAGDMYNGSPTVDYGLVDWTVSSDERHAFGIQLGRVKNNLGLYNATRDVASTRPSILLPQQVYFDKVRNLVLSADSVHAHGRISTDLGNWIFDLGVGRNPIDKNVEFAFLGTDLPGELDASGPSLVAHIGYESGLGAWRLALSAATTKLAFDADPGAPVGDGEVDVLYWIASAQYNAERWTLTAEYMEEPVDFDDFGPLYDDRDSTVQGYYLQGSYLLRDNLEWVIRYAAGYTDKDDRDGERQSAVTGGLAPPHSFFQKDWMMGLRWDVTPRLMLRAEYQWSNGTWTLSPRENRIPNATKEDWEMLSLLASYRF